jgi:acetyl-CoA carboxylase biotin carboxylase subunit
MIRKILIANRGEIALRIIRACREMGIDTVAVYSQADRDSLHVRFADEAVCIGPPSSTDSYLNIPQLISAVEVTDADAIHPGYGFLAENAEFADICHSHGIIFVGPSAETIGQMGDKAFARKMMSEAGVPVTPGSTEAIENAERAIEIANDIGFPVILKAVAGGGGRGMRIVRTREAMETAFDMARAEALSGFKNAELYIEKYLQNPRHVEIQVIGDKQGNAVYIGERDCSIQRRHQKLVEESPSPAVTPELRKEMGETAVRAAKAVKYDSTGTVEFLLDGDGHFHFMEMNTRIQVEHPVTEMVSGLDLIKDQISVAGGEPLPYKQKDIKLTGHAIECRLNAEDPDREFLPTPGKIESFHIPGGPGVRVDTHAYAGYVVPAYYDSLLAKLITHGRDREEALIRMQRALEEFIVEGIPTTIPFHQLVLSHESFQSGNYHTGSIEQIISSQKETVGRTA